MCNCANQWAWEELTLKRQLEEARLKADEQADALRRVRRELQVLKAGICAEEALNGRRMATVVDDGQTPQP